MWTYERDNEVQWDGDDELYWEYFTINDDNGDDVARCDDEKTARLIVAAPELLEELIKVTEYLDDIAQSNDAQRFIDSANLVIAKALGETK